MQIVNHRLEGEKITYKSAASGGGSITPKFLVLHCTDTWNAQQAVDIFQDASTRVSAHLVLDRDGSIVQMVTFDQKANHAGKSFWKGYSDLNAHSIGIEIVNYGGTPMMDGSTPLSREGHPISRVDYDKNMCNATDRWFRGVHPLDEGKQPMLWQKYTEAQFRVLDIIVPLIVDAYNIRDVVGHEEVAIPLGRKDDPGPAFPLKHYKKFADHGNAGSEGRYIVVTNELNVRGGPGNSYEIIGKLARGDSAKVLKFEGNWALITYESARAWVHGSFLMKA